MLDVRIKVRHPYSEIRNPDFSGIRIRNPAKKKTKRRTKKKIQERERESIKVFPRANFVTLAFLLQATMMIMMIRKMMRGVDG